MRLTCLSYKESKKCLQNFDWGISSKLVTCKIEKYWLLNRVHVAWCNMSDIKLSGWITGGFVDTIRPFVFPY